MPIQSERPPAGHGGWAAVTAPWRTCLEDAWESWCSGSLGVGAVAVDQRGTVVARGRNREGENDAPPGLLAGNYLAHAEMNVLASLPRRRHPGHVLLTSLEPCLMCMSALVMARLPMVEYAAADPAMDGLGAAFAKLPYAAGRMPHVSGPQPGPLRTFAELLPVLHMLEHRPDSSGLAARRHHSHDRVLTAESVLREHGATQLRTLSCPEAFEVITTFSTPAGHPTAGAENE